MNRDEAQFILRACPPDGVHADDPKLRKALDMMEHDPVLAGWFAQEQALDTRLSGKLRAFPVPPDLKGQLLAARGVMPLRPWWRRREWLAAAACVLLAATLAVLLFRPAGEPQFAQFQDYVADTTATLEYLDLASHDVTELRHWLQNRGAPSDFVLPASFSERPSIGCRIFKWKGRPVSLVCFRIGEGHEVHLFVMDGAQLRNTPASDIPQFARKDHGISTAAWRNDRTVYVLATNASEEALRRLL